jgi:hypothetical protein
VEQSKIQNGKRTVLEENMEWMDSGRIKQKPNGKGSQNQKEINRPTKNCEVLGL